MFKEFAAASPCVIEIESIEKRQPPEPDILCRCVEGSSIAFEMVGLDDPRQSQRLYDRLAIEKRLLQEYQSVSDSLDPVARNRMKARKFVLTFRDGISKNKKVKAVPKIIGFLAALDASTLGSVEPSRELGSVVNKIVVREHGLPADQPKFTIDSGGHSGDYTVERITNKLARQYESNARIELLAWVSATLPENRWSGQLTRLLQERLGASVFRRVWLFDRSQRQILFVYP